MPPRDHISDFLGKQADIKLKEAQEAKDKAKAHYYEEKTKEIRDKRGNDLSSLARKYGIDPSKFGER